MGAFSALIKALTPVPTTLELNSTAHSIGELLDFDFVGGVSPAAVHRSKLTLTTI